MTVVLLYNNSTMDLFFNKYLVEDIKKVNIPLRIQSNGGKFSVNHRSKITEYNKRVCFVRRGFTNTIALKT